MKSTRTLFLALFLALPVAGVASIVLHNEFGGTYTRNERVSVIYDLNNLMDGQHLLYRFEGDSEPRRYNLPDINPADLARVLSDKPHQMELDIGMDGRSIKHIGNLYIDGMPYHDFVLTPAFLR